MVEVNGSPTEPEDGSYVVGELTSQPACWRRALASVDQVSSELPPSGARLAVIGCGTSFFMAQALAARRENLGSGQTDAFPASELPVGRGYDHVLAISRSGTTSEVLDSVRRAQTDGAAVTAVTAVPDSPVTATANRSVVLDYADERSVVQTRFATTALVLLRACFGEQLADLPKQATAATQDPLDDRWLRATRFAFLGLGWAAGVAQEAALKLRETARMWTEAYPAMEYRHGPIAIADESSVVWSFGPLPAGMAEEIVATGALLVTSELDPAADLIRAQRVGVALARRKGLDPDRPRNLGRSVILS